MVKFYQHFLTLRFIKNLKCTSRLILLTLYSRYRKTAHLNTRNIPNPNKVVFLNGYMSFDYLDRPIPVQYSDAIQIADQQWSDF